MSNQAPPWQIDRLLFSFSWFSIKRNGNPLKNAADRGTKSTLLGISVNLVLGFAECSAGLLGNSFALAADGLEAAWMS